MRVESYSIKDVCEVFDGPHATPSPSDEGPIYLGITSIRDDGSIDYEGSKRIAWDEYPKWTKRVTPQAGDVVFSYEANLGTYAIIPDGFVGCLGRRMAVMRSYPEKVLPKYLYYYMLSPRWKEVIAGKTVLGATVNRIPIASYPDFPIELPDVDTQSRIVSVLSAYDELIENSRRQIKLLEEAAQRLYKEWFIDLKYPGHETTPIVDGLPEGWKRGTLGDLVEFRRGKTITKADTEIGGVPVVAGGVGPAYYHSVSNTACPVITVSGSGANAGFTRLYAREIWASDCSFADVSMTEHLLFVFVSIKTLANEFKQCQRGSAQPHVYPKHVNTLKLLLPTDELTNVYELQIKPLFELQAAHEARIAAAREARDRLLPKLMSGEIEV